MPNDMNVTASVAVAPESPEPVARVAETAAVSSKAPAHSATALFANPTLKLNSDLGIVVIEFRNTGGSVTSQFPSQRQLDAYIAGSERVPDSTDGDAASSSAHPVNHAA